MKTLWLWWWGEMAAGENEDLGETKKKGERKKGENCIKTG